VVHHLFPQIPHYHLEEATEAAKKVMGPYYRWVAPRLGGGWLLGRVMGLGPRTLVWARWIVGVVGEVFLVWGWGGRPKGDSCLPCGLPCWCELPTSSTLCVVAPWPIRQSSCGYLATTCTVPALHLCLSDPAPLLLLLLPLRLSDHAVVLRLLLSDAPQGAPA
jgi:hypothetical protein